MPPHPESPVIPLPDLHCACAGLRRAARLVTQLYSQLMGANIEPTQFALLSAIGQQKLASQAQLGRALGLDKTTLSRNLRLLLKNGWIEPSLSEDKRQRGYQLTSPGRKILSDTTPAWQRAQAKLQAALHPGDWDAMLKAFDRVAEAALAAQQADPASQS